MKGDKKNNSAVLFSAELFFKKLWHLYLYHTGKDGFKFLVGEVYRFNIKEIIMVSPDIRFFFNSLLNRFAKDTDFISLHDLGFNFHAFGINCQYTSYAGWEIKAFLRLPKNVLGKHK